MNVLVFVLAVVALAAVAVAIFLALSGVLAGVGVSAVTLAPAMKASDRGEHRREHRFVGVGFGIVVLLVVAWTKGVSRLLAAIAIDGGGGMYGPVMKGA